MMAPAVHAYAHTTIAETRSGAESLNYRPLWLRNLRDSTPTSEWAASSTRARKKRDVFQADGLHEDANPTRRPVPHPLSRLPAHGFPRPVMCLSPTGSNRVLRPKLACAAWRVAEPGCRATGNRASWITALGRRTICVMGRNAASPAPSSTTCTPTTKAESGPANRQRLHIGETYDASNS
jgi:hypothetical protein